MILYQIGATRKSAFSKIAPLRGEKGKEE